VTLRVTPLRMMNVVGARGPGHQPWETRCPNHRQPQTEDRIVRLARGVGGEDRRRSNELMKSPFDWSAEPATGMNMPRFHPTLRWFLSRKVVSSYHW
jgi:hypothetical protein